MSRSTAASNRVRTRYQLEHRQNDDHRREKSNAENVFYVVYN